MALAFTSFRFLPFVLLLGCKYTEPTPVDLLPPATQTGANTFGCLVNGQPWTPRGNDGYPNYGVSYDEGLNGGVFDLQTYRYPPGSKDFEALSFDVLSNCQVGSYSFRNPRRSRVYFWNTKAKCYLDSKDSTTYRQGTLTITKLDLKAGIIAGTFAFTLYKPGCDSVHVTQGRFDKQL
jgi:hypothetical protein